MIMSAKPLSQNGIIHAGLTYYPHQRRIKASPLCPSVSVPLPGDGGQPEQHAVPGRVRPLLRALVPSVGDGPPDPADPLPREGPHAPLAALGLGVPLHAGRAPTAQQESRLNVHEDTHTHTHTHTHTDLPSLSFVMPALLRIFLFFFFIIIFL